MDADTYPQQEVTNFFNEFYIILTLRVPHDQKPFSDMFQVRWTPKLMVLDPKERIQQVAVGFQSPAELIPWTKLGIGKTHFNNKDWPAALKIFQRVIDEHPKSSSTPEAVYFHGVSKFLQDHDTAHLKATHQIIRKDYPDSIWVERSSPYTKL